MLADNHDVISLKVYDVDGPGAVPAQNEKEPSSEASHAIYSVNSF